MKSPRLRRTLLRGGALAFLLLAMFQGRGAAYLRLAPEAWTKTSPDGRYLLVMLRKPAAGGAGSAAPAWKTICAAYPQSGVYRNDGSREMLWQIDGYCLEGDVRFSPDGRQVVIAGCESWVGAGSFRIAFLAAGRAPKWVVFSRCVPFGRLKRKFSYRFFEPREFRFDPAGLTCTVRSEMGENLVFDARTGALRAVSSPWHRCALGLLACLLAVIAVLAWGLARRRRKTSPPHC